MRASATTSRLPSARQNHLVVRNGAVAREVISEHVVHIDQVGYGGPGGGMSPSSVEFNGRLLRQGRSPGGRIIAQHEVSEEDIRLSADLESRREQARAEFTRAVMPGVGGTS